MHNIMGSDRVIYTQGDRPWHDLAAYVGAVASVKEMLVRAKLDWQVELIQLSVPNHVTGAWEKVNAWSVVRSTDGKVLAAAVGRQFRPIQNAKAFDTLLSPFVDNGLVTLDTAGSLRDGGRVWMSAKVNRDPIVIVPKAGDVVELYLMACNGHDGSLALHGGFSGTRPVCDNTVSAATDGAAKSGMVKIRHTAGAENALKAAAETIARAGKNFEAAADVFKGLAGKYVTEKQIRTFIDKVFPPAKNVDVDAASTIAAKMAEFTDEPTSPDVLPMIELPTVATTPAAKVAANLDNAFAALLAKPVQSTAIVAGTMTTGDADVARLLGKPASTDRRVADNIVEIFESGGRRGDLNLPGVKGTAWAAYNAVTEYQTWHRGANAENRFNTIHFQDQGMPARTLAAAADTFLS